MATEFRSSRDVIIRTPGWSDAVTFYRSVLGLPVVHQDDILVGFEIGSFRLYVERGGPHGPVYEFLVPDVPAAKQHLLASGCAVVEEDPAVPRCYLRDPYGLVRAGVQPGPWARGGISPISSPASDGGQRSPRSSRFYPG
jgi:catechol 2,3-dioxygenase-like lactoylglutathione lyase family enzyme